jgi:hypothetical protein
MIVKGTLPERRCTIQSPAGGSRVQYSKFKEYSDACIQRAKQQEVETRQQSSRSGDEHEGGDAC